MKKYFVLIAMICGIMFSCKPDPETENPGNNNGGGNAEEEVIEEGKINGYEYVDLGLPSGLKWASCNVGASTPYEAGHYYSWGDLKLKIKFFDSNCPTYGVDMNEDISGNKEYDVCAALWGSTWRLPTSAEARELIDNCTWEWVTDYEIQGSKVTGPNGNQIFLPGAGFKEGETLGFYESEGAYWTSIPDVESPATHSVFMYFYQDNWRNLGWFSRYAGLSVRAVSE